MPLYTYRRKDDYSVEVEVLRSFNEYQTPPQPDEYENADDYEWERIISGKVTITKGDGFGSKGNW